MKKQTEEAIWDWANDWVGQVHCEGDYLCVVEGLNELLNFLVSEEEKCGECKHNYVKSAIVCDLGCVTIVFICPKCGDVIKTHV